MIASPAVVGAIGAAVYLLTPAAAASPLGGWPLTPFGTLALAMAIAVALPAWRWPGGTGARWIGIGVVVLIVVRATAAVAASEPGWLARYYVNDSWQGSPAWSSDFRFTDATRIDRALSFDRGEFPVHYLNGPAFTETPGNRDVVVPMSVEWTAAFHLAARETLVVASRVIGSVAISIDGSPLLSTDGRAADEITLDGGPHAVRVAYAKPADVAGALHVELRRKTDDSAIEVFQPGSSPARRPAIDAVAVGADGAMVLLLIAVTVTTLGRLLRSESRLQFGLGALVVVMLAVQGFVTALPFTKFHTLTAGDDWLGFESRARNLLQQGLLMPLERPIGEGAPYFYHPLYSYVLAAVHAVTGESLFGPIFVHFLLLAATAIVTFSLVRSFFGVVPAFYGVAALVAVFELDFIRYYTVTLLSENLYVFTVTCCLAAFTRWAETSRTAWLVQAGIWGGISTATRPVMMVFLPLALGVAAWLAVGRQPGPFRGPLILGGAWMACVLPWTIRNWIVSRELVLVSSGQGGAVIAHTVPPPLDPAPYLEAYRTGGATSIGVLWRLVVEHPAEVAALQFKKIGFTLGMVHWFEGYRPHPELLAVTLLYISMFFVSRTMRHPGLWPVHAFVVSHWASMLLTSPWNYGYRLILPAYVYTTALSVAAATAAMQAWRPAHR